VAYFEDLG